MNPLFYIGVACNSPLVLNVSELEKALVLSLMLRITGVVGTMSILWCYACLFQL
jgi:hypothetical protein